MSPAPASSTSTRCEPVEGVELGDPVPLEPLVGHGAGLAQRQQRHLIAHPHPAPLDPPDRDAAQEAREVERGDQHLERPLGVALGRGDVVEDGLEQRLEIGAGMLQLRVAVPARLEV